MNWQIITPSYEHIEKLATMHEQSWLDTYVGIDPVITEDWVKKRFESRRTKKGIDFTKKMIARAAQSTDEFIFKIALLDSELVGFCNAEKSTEKQEVQAVYVSEEQKGSGLAAKLMLLILDWMDLERDIEVWTATGNIRAVAFYEKYKFVLIPESEKYHDEENKVLKIVKMIRKGEKR